MFSCGVFFLVFLSKCLSKYPSSTKPSLPRKISGYIPALRDHYFCKVIHLTCLTGFWIRLRLDSSSVICTVILCIYCTRYVQNSDIFRTLFIQACAIMFRYVQHYYGLFRDIEALLRHIQVYSARFSILCNPRKFTTFPYDIFKIEGIFKTQCRIDQLYSEPSHSLFLRSILFII